MGRKRRSTTPTWPRGPRSTPRSSMDGSPRCSPAADARRPAGWEPYAPSSLPLSRPRGRRCCGTSSDGANVRRLGALLALGDVELHTLVLVQRAVAVGLDGGEVDEDVGSAAVRRDEAEALLAVEPLHGALCHVLS